MRILFFKNYSFERRTGFGIFLKFSIILLDLLGFSWNFFGIFSDLFPMGVYGIFPENLATSIIETTKSHQIAKRAQKILKGTI